MSTELERYKKAVAVLTEALKQYTHPDATSVCDVLANVYELLNPPPEYEEVEVVRWECQHCGVIEKVSFDVCICCSTNIVKLTGTLRRPKPQKVERSVSVGVEIGEDGYTLLPSNHVGGFFTSHPRCHGKSGTLTFTWTEEGEGK